MIFLRMCPSIHCRKALLISCAHAGNLITVKFIKDKAVSGELSYQDLMWAIPITFYSANLDITRVDEIVKLIVVSICYVVVEWHYNMFSQIYIGYFVTLD